MKEILVAEVMSPNVARITPDVPLAVVLELMTSQRLSYVVVTEDSIPIGIITERDLVSLFHQMVAKGEQLLDLPADAFMTAPIHTLNKTDKLFDALVISRAEVIRHLPVIDEQNHLAGIVTQSELSHAHFDVIDRQSDMIEKAVAAKMEDLQVLNDRLKTLSMEDHLLGIGNRRAMEADLEHTHAAAVRYNQTYSLVLLDLDYFKRFNDFYGHKQGDVILRTVTDTLKETVRRSDRLYRYGGEELLLLLPNTPEEEACLLADRLVSRIRESRLKHQASPYGIVTLSAGTAQVQVHGKMMESWTMVIEQADQALYAAKAGGRNKAIRASGVEDAEPAAAVVHLP